MILVDTSVWVNHLREGSPPLKSLLEADEVACHPFIIGELACGGIPNRAGVLALLAALPSLPKANDDEVLRFIEGRRLMSRGLGLVDVHLLSSCLLAGVLLWTADAKLAAAAAELRLRANQ